MADASKKWLLDILARPGNNVCADCQDKDPTWASYSIGVFVCKACASTHRSLGVHISRVKSVKLDNWEDEQVQMMEDTGNIKARERYEQFVPAYYKRPTFEDAEVLKEQWIRAKYERREFEDKDKQRSLHGNKKGYLYKKGRDDARFLVRRFELSQQDGKLSYYIKENASKPKAMLSIDEMNCTFVPLKVGNPNGMQITYDKDGTTRNIFVYAETAKDIVEWFNCIRSCKLNRLRIGLPNADDEELKSRLTRNFVKEGWLYKTGPRPTDAWRKRWFTMDMRKLMYFDDKLDAYPKGEVFVGPQSEGFAVHVGVPIGRQDAQPSLSSFTLRTPGRDFLLAAETMEERDTWVERIRSVLTMTLSPQDRQQKRSLQQ